MAAERGNVEQSDDRQQREEITMDVHGRAR